MSLANRLLRRQNYPLLTRALRTQFSYQVSGGTTSESSHLRFLSTPAKNPAPPQQDGPKSEAKPESGSVPPKPQPTTAQQKPQAPQAVPKPPQKPQVNTAATPQKVTGQPAQTTTQKPPVQSATPAASKVQATPAAPRIQTGVPRVQGAPQAAAGAPRVPGAQAGVPRAQSGSKVKVLLASGAVASLVLGLFYWQSPRLHDGAIENDTNKDNVPSGGITPEQTEQNIHLGADNVEKQADGTAVKSSLEPSSPNDTDMKNSSKPSNADDTDVTGSLEPGNTEEKANNGDVKVTFNPESVKVETPTEVTEFGEKQENGNAVVEQRQTEDSQSPSVEIQPPSKGITFKFEDDPNGESLKKVVITESIEGSPGENTVVKDEHGDLSKEFIQRGHEVNAKQHEEGDILLSYDEKKASTLSGVDIVTAIHAAEQRQADIDAAAFKEKLHVLEEKHKHELSDMEHRLLLLQEQIRQLQEGIEMDKLRHIEDLKLQKEEAEARLDTQIKLMEEAKQRQLEEVELLVKSEAAKVLAEDRASFMNEIGSVKLHMEAMHLALESKSEEAREGHEIKQLALGSFVLEDALQEGAPVEKEAALLMKSTGGDPLVEVAVTSLPKEVLQKGTLTPAQLNQRLEEIEGALRELAFIPSSGGGVLCHLLAKLAASLKLPDHGKYDDDGVDAVITRVKQCMRDGKLVDAADILSLGLLGTNGERLAAEWGNQARNRAIAEQACSLLRAHAAALALGDSYTS